jgi:plastocyanin
MRLRAFLIYSTISVLAACGNGSATSPSASGPTGTAIGATVSIAEYAFAPSSITVKVGTTVEWTNNGQLTHNLAADDGSWTSGNLGGSSSGGAYGGSTSGDSFGRVFSQAGTYTYHCSLHPPSRYPGFVGTVIVTP